MQRSSTHQLSIITPLQSPSSHERHSRINRSPTTTPSPNHPHPPPATNGVVIATEKKLPSVLIDEAHVQKVELITPSTGQYSRRQGL